MPRQEIGEVEGAGSSLGERLEGRAAGEELVAVRAGDALHALLAQHRVQQTAGAAVGIDHEDGRESRPRAARIFARTASGIFSGTVVQVGRQALHLQVRPAVQPAQRDDLVRQCAAGDDQGRDARPMVVLGLPGLLRAHAPARLSAAARRARSASWRSPPPRRRHGSRRRRPPPAELLVQRAPPTSTM